MKLTRAARWVADAVAWALTRGRADADQGDEDASTDPPAPTRLADVRRELRDLADRRLFGPLDADELLRYQELCAIEREELRRPVDIGRAQETR